MDLIIYLNLEIGKEINKQIYKINEIIDLKNKIKIYQALALKYKAIFNSIELRLSVKT